jgi:hypothetical protein
MHGMECMSQSGWCGVQVLEVREAMQHHGLSNSGLCSAEVNGKTHTLQRWSR